jgi:hypothetical protein
MRAAGTHKGDILLFSSRGVGVVKGFLFGPQLTAATSTNSLLAESDSYDANGNQTGTGYTWAGERT